MDQSPVVFVHVPKTAGTTVRALLRHNYKDVIDFESESEYVEQLPRLRSRPIAAAYQGHMPYGIHNALGIEVRYITFVRHPAARVRSIYNDLRRRGDNRRRALEIPFEEFALESYHPNPMARQLAGSTSAGDLPRDDDELYERALANMRSMAAVGVQEQFDLSLALLSKRLGWRVPTYGSHNLAPASQDSAVSREVGEAIMARDAVDLALFERASRDLESAADLRGRMTLIRVINDPRLTRVRSVPSQLRRSARLRARMR